VFRIRRPDAGRVQGGNRERNDCAERDGHPPVELRRDEHCGDGCEETSEGRAHVVEPERLSDVLEPIGEQRGGSREVEARADAEEDAEQCERGERGRGRQQ